MFLAPFALGQETAVELGEAKLSGDEKIATPIGEIKLVDTYFNDDASRRLFDELEYQRACQAYLWSTPLVSTTAWRDNQGEAFGVTAETDFVVLRSLKKKRGIVTGNLTTPYIFNFSNLKSGPIKIEYPAGQTAGAVLDFWMRPLCDLGLTGPDQGKGATYVIVGPEVDMKKYEREGVYLFQNATNNLMIGIRVLDPEPALLFHLQVKLQNGTGRCKADTKSVH